jgi:SAM-dependent methyltransferase
MDDLRSPSELAQYRLQDPALPDTPHIIASMAHRQRVIRYWGIPRGSRVLEIGCGQGDFAIPLADAVGPGGRVVAVDPAPPTYGTPPLSEAQPHILSSPVGSPVVFVEADAVAYLDSTTDDFDFIVLGHCIWYFGDPGFLPRILARAAAGVGRRNPGVKLLIAELALRSSRPCGLPHLLAALTLNALESFDPKRSWRNVCCALTPAQITAAARQAGWALREDLLLAPVPGQKDGWREVAMILHKKDIFGRDVRALDVSDKIQSMLFGMRDAVAMSLEAVDGGMDGVTNMDAWAASFEIEAVTE